MPTEQEVIDAIVLDEEVPHFILEEMVEMRTQFAIAKNRRGARREEAWDTLQELVEGKLHSQYESYKGLISTLKVKATKAWIEEDCSTAIIILRESVEKLILQKQHWKQAYERLTVRESELIRENIYLKNKVNRIENGAFDVRKRFDPEEVGGGEC